MMSPLPPFHGRPCARGALQVRLGAILGLLVLTAAMLLNSFSSSAGAAAQQATLPQRVVDTTYVTPRGTIIPVADGGDFQAALARATPGDVIELEAGVTFQGPFTLPGKTGSDWITIRSAVQGTAERAAAGASLPPPGIRVTPAEAGLMATLTSRSGPVISAAPGAHHYRFIGVEITPEERVFLENLVDLSAPGESGERLPHHIIFDRCYLHGDPQVGARRGIALNSAHSAVVDSWLSDFKMRGADSQAIAGWDGPGPYKISNNYIEAAGENLMFGGADPQVKDRVPADIEILGNHFAKPLAWKVGGPGHDGSRWTIKNLFELKNARRVLVDGNLFEYHWPEAQGGFAILFTVRNQEGSAPWSVVEDVTFSNNLITHVADGINILGQDDHHPSQPTRRIFITNNLFDDVGGDWGDGRLLQLLDGVEDVVLEHNTVLNTSSILVSEGDPHKGFAFSNNIVMHNAFGMIGTGTGSGQSTLNRYFEDPLVQGNVFIGGPAGSYPAGNDFPRSLEAVGFRDPLGLDFRLSDGSRFRQTDKGPAPGVDMQALCAALSVTEKSAYCIAP